MRSRIGLAILLGSLLAGSSAFAADRYAVIVTGASSGTPYAERYDRWRDALVASFTGTFQYPADHVAVLAETERPHVLKATRETVRRVFLGLRSRLMADDLLVVILIGHGTVGEEGEAKFNLVGPDLDAGEWAALVKPLPGRLVFVDTTGGSFPFLRRLAAPGRVVLTATDSAAQRFETVFPEFLVKAFEDPAADLDKNGRVSLWETFSYASAGVRQWYEQQGRLPTERPLLDDDGDGNGREARNPGSDGALARTLYVAPVPADDSPQARRLAELQRELDDLRARKGASDDPGRFDAEIERVVLEIARLSRGGRRESRGLPR